MNKIDRYEITLSKTVQFSNAGKNSKRRNNHYLNRAVLISRIAEQRKAGNFIQFHLFLGDEDFDIIP
jgi:hypothetical protein